MTIQEFLQGDKFALLAGVELLETASGYAKARMEIKPEHLNGGGVCQGGAIFTLAGPGLCSSHKTVMHA